LSGSVHAPSIYFFLPESMLRAEQRAAHCLSPSILLPLPLKLCLLRALKFRYEMLREFLAKRKRGGD
jgi:hypothetical protein